MATQNQLNFPFSDLIAGYIRKVSYPDAFDCKGEVELETSDGRMYTSRLRMRPTPNWSETWESHFKWLQISVRSW